MYLPQGGQSRNYTQSCTISRVFAGACSRRTLSRTIAIRILKPRVITFFRLIQKIKPKSSYPSPGLLRVFPFPLLFRVWVGFLPFGEPTPAPKQLKLFHVGVFLGGKSRFVYLIMFFWISNSFSFWLCVYSGNSFSLSDFFFQPLRVKVKHPSCWRCFRGLGPLGLQKSAGKAQVLYF